MTVQKTMQELEEENQLMLRALWEIVVLSGADTDNATRFHCSTSDACMWAMNEVRILADKYDESIDEMIEMSEALESLK